MKSTREARPTVGKIIFWIVVFFLVLLALRLVSVHKTRADAKERREDEEAKRNAAGQKSANRDDTPAQDSMIKCTRCGVFVPKANTVRASTGLVCNDKACSHRR
jgi:hypothetical protein